MANTAERDARLDALLSATKSWANKRRTELQNRVTVGKQILKGRTGSERLATSTVNAANVLVVDEIEDFLLTP